MKTGIKIAVVSTAAGLAFTGLGAAAFAATVDPTLLTNSEQVAIEETNRVAAEQFISEQQATIAELTAQLAALDSELASAQSTYDAAVAAGNASSSGSTAFAAPPASRSSQVAPAPQNAQPYYSDDDHDDDHDDHDDHNGDDDD